MGGGGAPLRFKMVGFIFGRDIACENWKKSNISLIFLYRPMGLDSGGLII